MDKILECMDRFHRCVCVCFFRGEWRGGRLFSQHGNEGEGDWGGVYLVSMVGVSDDTITEAGGGLERGGGGRVCGGG